MNRKRAIELLHGEQKGVAAWNMLRDLNEEIPRLNGLDLQGAILLGANLSELDLSESNLRGARIWNSDLSRTNLKNANLTKTTLYKTNLTRAILYGSTLDKAQVLDCALNDALLDNARLTSVQLDDSRFCNASLHSATIDPLSAQGADFHDASLAYSRICGSLVGAKGLSETVHSGPSSISVDAILRLPETPEFFLRGCGLRNEEIEYFRSQIGTPIRFYSCFICYCHSDRTFARRLHDQLQGLGIRCWLDEHALLPGDKIHDVVNQAIRVWDKVLLCASEAALKSWWVENEVLSAFAKEQRLHKLKGVENLALIPLDLDGYMFSESWQSGWKDKICARFAPDFWGWEKDNSIFEAQFEKVVAALRADENARPRPPASLL